MMKLRTWLRLLSGMISLSIGGELKQLFKILKGLALLQCGDDKDRFQTSLNVLASFAKAGADDFLGLSPHQSHTSKATEQASCLALPALKL